MINDEFQYFYKYAEELSNSFIATKMCNSILRASWREPYTLEDILKLNYEDVLKLRNVGKKSADLFVKARELYLERRYHIYKECLDLLEKGFGACHEALEDDSTRVGDAMLRYKNGDITKEELYRIGVEVSTDLVYQGRKLSTVTELLLKSEVCK